jgi:hypothetical protein
MGIRHRGALRGAEGGAIPLEPPGLGRRRPLKRVVGSVRLHWLRRILYSASVTTLILSPLTGAPAGISEYRCTPDIKHECSAAGCETMNDGFQHAESFAYQPKKRELSACLWTNCYAGDATVFAGAKPGTFTVMGRLLPAAHPGNEPVIVTLTIKTGNTSNKAEPLDTLDKDAARFTAVWGYGSEGLAVDMGKCLTVR